MDVGPHRDLIAELANAVRTNSTLKFGLYHSLFEWFNPMYLSDKQCSFKQKTFVTNKVSIRTGHLFPNKCKRWHSMFIYIEMPSMISNANKKCS